jgi:glycosyltransferase involved in cell wall biosynthesis
VPEHTEPAPSGGSAKFSIIIPAHNEEAVIGRCLKSLLDGLGADAEVLVCSNGCTDRTEQIAATFERVRVLKVPVASKPAALNAGDRAASGQVKVFLDADVVVSGRDVRKVVERLQRGPELVAAPRIVVDASAASWPVKAYYAVWMKTPYVTDGMVGSGFYALSERGRSRFAEFPNIVGDDTYVRILFAPHERAVVTDASFAVYPPKTLGALIDIETRRKAGHDEICALLSESQRPRNKSQGFALGKMTLNPLAWPSLLVYAYVKVTSRVRYQFRKRAGTHKRWIRDETSRAM